VTESADPVSMPTQDYQWHLQHLGFLPLEFFGRTPTESKKEKTVSWQPFVVIMVSLKHTRGLRAMILMLFFKA
jgi:hypothetical protein